MAQQATLEEYTRSAGALSSSDEEFEKRLAATEEWVESFNGYRTQMYSKLMDLQSSVNSLQGQ